MDVQYLFQPVPRTEWDALPSGSVLMFEGVIHGESTGKVPCVMVASKMKHPTEKGLLIRFGNPHQENPKAQTFTLLEEGITNLWKGIVWTSSN